jgi:hypothetical protein
MAPADPTEYFLPLADWMAAFTLLPKLINLSLSTGSCDV